MHLGTYNNAPHRKFFWVFLLLVLVMAGVVINYTLARATIIIHPKVEKKASQVNITIDAKAQKPDLENSIQTGKIVEIQGELNQTVAAETLHKVEDFAKGAVTIKNIWKKDFFLQAGAQLIEGDSPETVGLAPKNIFVLDSDTNVPANGEIEAAVTAKNRGLAGNIPPGKFYFLRMSQWNRDRIWAENETYFSGGEKETRVVSQDDIIKAIQRTAEDLGKQEIEKIKLQTADNEKVSPALTRVEILESRASVAPETEAENYEVYVKGKVSTIVFNEKSLKDMALEKFKEQVGSDREIENIDENSIKYELSDLSGNDGKAEVKITVPAVLMSKLPSKILDKQAIIGYNASALRERYAKFPEVDSIDVKFFPFWVKSVPSFEGQTSFDVKTE